MERISPFDMFVDPDARHPKEMRWIAQRTWRPSPTSRSTSGTRPPTARRSVPSPGPLSEEAPTATPATTSPTTGSQYAEIIEFYDIKRKRCRTFALDSTADGGNDPAGFLIKPKKMPYAIGHPFVMLRNFEVPDHFYPIGDVEQIESLQLELNETRTQMLNYRKKFAASGSTRRTPSTATASRRSKSDVDNVMIPVIGDGDPAKAIAPVPTVITPPEFFDQSTMITNDIDRVSGVSATTSVERRPPSSGPPPRPP